MSVPPPLYRGVSCTSSSVAESVAPEPTTAAAHEASIRHMTRRAPITFLAGLAAVALVALAVAGCGSNNDSTPSASAAPPKTSSGKPATVGVANSGLGNILVDSQGRTLYLFKKDTGTKSQCSGACAVEWPPLRASRKPTAGRGVSASKLGTSARSDGQPQVTYNGHPLYLFQGDSKAGDTNGQGLTEFGAVWYVVSPAGNEITGQSVATGGGRGY